MMVDEMSFHMRLQRLARDKKIFQSDLVSSLKKTSSTISKWWNGDIVPGPKNIMLLADYFGCDPDWLATGKGKPYPTPKAETALEKRFFKRRQADLEDEAAAKTRRDRFKMQCLGLFDELYDFVGDRYGEDREAVNDFLDELEKLNSNFRTWRAEKKEARDSTASLRGGAKIANNGE